MLKQPSIKFLVDESVEYGIVKFLRSEGYDVFSITEENPSIDDLEVLQKAYLQKRILITNDKGFSALIFKRKQKSHGVVLIRMPFNTTAEKISMLNQVINSKTQELINLFATITHTKTRFKKF